MIFIKKRIVPLLIILLVALSVFSTPANAASPFKDVKTNYWAYSAIEWAYNEGIISGFPNGTFAPDSMITEAQFVTMLIRFDCTSANSFAANPWEHKASGNYRYLQSKNIPLNGYASMAMRDMPIKKGQVARVAAAFAGLDLSESHAVQYMYKNDLANGATGKNDYKDYGANQSMSRAEAAVFFQRLSKLGSCDLIGLSTKANGSNDSKTPLPPNFLGAGGVTFVPPEVKPLPPIFSSPGNVAFADVDIDKETLIANGKDSTFVTVSLKTCSGDPISYEDSLSFLATSNGGASIDGGNFGPPVNDPSKGLDDAIKAVDTAREKAAKAWSIAKEAETAWLEYKPEDKLYFDSFLKTDESDKKAGAAENSTIDVVATQAEISKSMVAAEAIHPNEKYGEWLARMAKETHQAAVAADAELEMALVNLANIRAGISAGPAALQPTSAYTNTDGPDVTVEIIAPAVTNSQTDTLSFQYTGTGNSDMDCYQKPVTVQLTYVAQADLQIETTQRIQVNADGTVQAVTDVTATITRAGGKPITDYNGRVRFRSTGGATLSNEFAYFQNGVARVTAASTWNGQGFRDELFAEIDQPDPRYQNEIASILKKSHSQKIFFEPELNLDKSCTFTAPQVAFIIDSSGSMQSSDKERLRVSKSKEFIEELNAGYNIGADFNSKGRILETGAVLQVKPKLDNIVQSGGTNIADGLKVAFNKFTGTGPKVAILLTDGKSDERKVLEMIETAKKEKIKVYTIGLGKKSQLNEALLQKLATQTGGHYFHVEKNVELGEAYQSIISEITCGIPAPTCTISDQAFISPKLETRGSEFFMNTYVSEGCGVITRVVLRFNSSEGNIDYELADRGQSYFELKKGTYEISNFNLLKQGLFLAYDAGGKVVAQKYVDMK